MRILSIIVTLFLGSVAQAQSVDDCDWRASAQAIPEPWGAYTRTFSNGQTRLALLDTVEPAAGAFHILILSPPFSELGDRQCKVISLDSAMGFAGADFAALGAGYDPATGLTFSLPVNVFHGSSGSIFPAALGFTLNQATGAIDAWLE